MIFLSVIDLRTTKAHLMVMPVVLTELDELPPTDQQFICTPMSRPKTICPSRLGSPHSFLAKQRPDFYHILKFRMKRTLPRSLSSEVKLQSSNMFSNGF
ncbi:hypothetical protein Pyn_23488 [Prunus yedoensis var. nudiflora]|uniref:Uncharacterized protein n=1 Tax=Prunus yedoensis var. nudiflora TaxID=2094558 RepID=A0A314ZLU9_PRUYE|nr:hypothetical protein Pyn_23488 [Prunus yedoensis var. nudiflora]